MNEIKKKLRILSTCYYVLAILCIPASFVAPLMIILSTQNSDDDMKGMVIFFSAVGLISSLILASGIAAVGYGLRKQRWRTYCFVVSCLICPSFPIGTALGVFSLIILNKPETKQIFTQQPLTPNMNKGVSL
ncbi:MAG: hypothetical protein KAU94_01600 [Verrucomicrobia bacterium]|nr:hypothetical protein [Verrucomicrobiota bacterium]